MIAGIDYSTGDGIISDGCRPSTSPECIPEIIEKFNDGYEVINMVRTKTSPQGCKNITSSGFYWLINHISDVHFEPNASDFFAISRHVAQVLKDNYREKVRFLRGYVQNVGFKKTNIEQGRARARVAGEKQIQYQKTVHILHKYDTLLLQYATKTGNLRRYAISIPWGSCYDIHPFHPTRCPKRLCNHSSPSLLHVCHDVPANRIIGEYIAILFTELKDRPVYIVEKTENM